MFLLGRLSVITAFTTLLLQACASSPPTAGASKALPVGSSVSAAPKTPSDGKVVVLFFSDLHGQLRPGVDGLGGYARLATLIRQERAAAPSNTDVLVILGGDAGAKSALPCRKTGEKECFQLFSSWGVDVAVIGNGELKRTVSELNELMRLSSIHWISSNLKALDPNKAGWTVDYNYKGIRSGADWWIGGWSIPPTPGEIDHRKAGYVFKENNSAADWQMWTQHATGKPLLLLSHQIYERDVPLLGEFCKKFPGRVLAMLKGHNHESHREDGSQCAPLLEPGPFGTAVSRLEFARDTSSPGGWTLKKHEFIEMNSQVAEDAETKAKIDALYAKWAPEADQVMGQVAADKSREEAAQWLADATQHVSRGDVAVINMGAVKSGIKAGALTRERILTVYPYNNELVGVDISVNELGQALCKASQRNKDLFLDDGSELVFSGVKMVNPGSPDCRLDAGRRSRIKLVLDSYLLSRSARWMGVDLAPRSFRFGMSTEKLIERGLQMGSGHL